MSCSDSNPCSDPCVDSTNPCYEDCGCINPTTFDCITKPGTHDALDITNDMTGKQALTAANAVVQELLDDKGKVTIDSSDTCPEYLLDKLEAGLNISLTRTGTGCSSKIVIDASAGGVPVDVKAKVSSNDTTNGYLTDKIETGTFLTKTTLSPAGNEKLEIDVVPSTLISADNGNMLTLGTDGALKTSYTTPDGTETIVTSGSGVTVTGDGSTGNPYVVSINPSITAVRTCADGVWRDVTLVATSNANVVYVSGTPKYRVRYDGSIEFKGSSTYTVAFGAYSTGNRKFTVIAGNIPTTCITSGEQAGTADLKGINYIDAPQASGDQIAQQYGYIVRKTNNNIVLEFQSSFSNSTSKTIVVNYDGVISHPNL